jgi:hypothetical protein
MRPIPSMSSRRMVRQRGQPVRVTADSQAHHGPNLARWMILSSAWRMARRRSMGVGISFNYDAEMRVEYFCIVPHPVDLYHQKTCFASLIRAI